MTKKPRGRPRVDPTDDTVAVAVRLPAREYDRLARTAIRASASVPEVIRRAIRRGADDKRSG